MRAAEAYSQLAGVYDEIVVDPCYSQWARYLDSLWRTDVSAVHDILDLACGTGLMAAELVRLGYQVHGVDASEAMLDRARGLLGDSATFQHVVLPDLPVAGPIDAATSNFDGLNYLTPDELSATFDAVAARLRPGGWFVFDLHTDAMLAFAIANAVVEGEDQGHRFVITSDIDPRTRVCDTRIELVHADGDDFIERHRQYFHEDDIVSAALASAGLDLIAVTDEYTALPADADTLRATWIARRGA